MHLPIQTYLAILLVATVSANSIRGWPRYEPVSDLARYGVSTDELVSSVLNTVNPAAILLISLLTTLADSFNNLGQITDSINPPLRSLIPCELKHGHLVEKKIEQGAVGGVDEESKGV